MAVGDPLTAACKKLKTAIAERCDVIAGQSERLLEDYDDYIKNRLPRSSFDPSLGPNPRTLRYGFAPAEERTYLPLLTDGFEAQDFEGANCAGENGTISADGNVKGAQCDLPGQELQGGWDEFGRYLKGKAFETGWECAMNLIQTHRYNDYLTGLANALKREFVKHHCWQLERDVITEAQYNTSCTDGFRTANGSFPVAPTGGLDLYTILRLRALMRAQGAMGDFEVGGVSFEAFESMRTHYVNTHMNGGGVNVDVTPLETRTDLLGRSTSRVRWADVTWQLTEFPLRGTLRNTPTGQELVPVRPTLSRAGTGGGIVPEPNEDYYNCETSCNGIVERVHEVAFIVFPTFAEVQAFSMPRVGAKGFESDLFSMALRLVDGETVTTKFGVGNVDNFKFFLRALHAYSFAVMNPEHAGAIIYQASPYQPAANTIACTDAPAESLIDPPYVNPQQHDDISTESCETCDNPPDPAHIVPTPTDGDLCPTGGNGEIRMIDCGTVFVDPVAGATILIGVVREDGTDGAATIDIDSADGSASSADNDFVIVNTQLSWADGEAGIKYVTVTLGSDPDQSGDNFTINASSPTGATLDAGCATTTIEFT